MCGYNFSIFTAFWTRLYAWVPRVFIIHGVGEGKLRETIADELRRRPEVHKFKNEYHTKYGYGATEVVFIEAQPTGHSALKKSRRELPPALFLVRKQ
ncbi:MAG: Smr/MutS family protein [Saprospirales bacterium]|nr:Smr/MutS family protein [Saprospirales bacterium]